MLFNSSGRQEGSSDLQVMQDHPSHRLSRMDPFYGESINHVLLDSLLFRRVVHEGSHSLLRAFSALLYSNSQYHHDIQQMLFAYVRQHAQLFTQQKGNPLQQTQHPNRKLAWFLANPHLIKDYLLNPLQGQHEMTTLEILSELFRVRIVIYTISNDNLLQSTIINNKFKQKAQLMRIGNHYDIISNLKQFERLVIAQQIVNEIVTGIMKDKENFTANRVCFPVQDSHYHYLESSYRNIEYEIWKDYTMTARKTSNKFSISLYPGRSRHKKSLSDSCNVGTILDQQIDTNSHRLYNMFTQHQPPQEFMDIIMDGKQRRMSDQQIEMIKEIQNMQEVIGQQGNQVGEVSPQYYAEKKEDDSEQEPPIEVLEVEEEGRFMSYEQQMNNINNQILQDQYFQMQKELIKQWQESQGNEESEEEVKQQEIVKNQQEIIQQHQDITLVDTINVIKKEEEDKEESLQVSVKKKHKKKGSKDTKEEELENSMKLENDKNKKLVIIEESQTRYTGIFINIIIKGRLKFFDEAKNYGFIVMDEDNSDIFVHFDDIAKANITKEYLRTTKLGNVINFSFACMTYIGKYDRSRKAVDLMLQPPNTLNYNQIIMNNVNMFLAGTTNLSTS